ncbi:hypothetical protein B566_EDAN010032 [Ephemera danica]|nr:hypothetical protein B566_EDAN010032 [Ephemera danica]
MSFLQFQADIMRYCSTSRTSDSNVCPGDCCICGCGFYSDSAWDDTRCKDCNEGKSGTSRKRFRPSCERLHRAIEKHDCRTIRQFLEDGIKPCTTGPINCFILAFKLKFILRKFLAIEPSGINCQDSRGYTMLMLSEDNMEYFNLLCKYKPDINILNNDGDNIFFHLLKSSHQFMFWQLGQLLELGLDVNSVSSKGETAMVVAIREGVHYFTIKKLLEAGATLPPPFKDGESIVTHPIQKNRSNLRSKVEFLETLMKHKIDVNAKDIDGRNVMYYIIQEQCKLLSNMREEINRSWLNYLERILIMLLKKNCEVQGLFLIFERGNLCIGPLNYSYREKLEIIGACARNIPGIKFLEQLVHRGLYNWTANLTTHRQLFPGTSDPMSPLTAYLSRLYTPSRLKTDFKQILETCKYFISIGVDATHRSLDRNFRFDASSCVRVYGTHFSNLAEELTYPDALYFVAQIGAIDISTCDLNEKDVMNFEELLRILVRFWPYPPLFLLLLRVGLEVWNHRPLPHDPIRLPHRASKDMTLITRLLIKIGGAVPMGTRFYKSLKTLLCQVAEDNHQQWPQIFDSFVKLDGGIPTLRSLSRAAFRATVKKTCPATGLDFSEYRVLCLGEMVPLPPKIISFLEFRS